MPTQCPGIHASECRTGLCQGQMHGNWSDPVSHRSWCHPPGIPQVRHRLQNLQIPPLLLQGPGPWRWKEGDWARTFWCRALVSSPCAHWGSTGGPRAPLPGNRNPRSCLVLTQTLLGQTLKTYHKLNQFPPPPKSQTNTNCHTYLFQRGQTLQFHQQCRNASPRHPYKHWIFF